MVFALASVLVGLVVLRWLDAPRDLFALLASLVAENVLALPITSFWKISIHAAAAAATVTSLAILVSPWWLILVPLVLLTGWARVEIRDRTPGQVLAGATVGATVGAVVGAVVAAGVLILAP
jgi:membrane-associated phospholipid phosphatase